MSNTVDQVPSPERLTEVVTIGVNSAGREPGYEPLATAGLCRVTAFEPDAAELRKLQQSQSPRRRYLPYAIGDGRQRTLSIGPWRYSLSGAGASGRGEQPGVDLFYSARSLGEISRSATVQTRRLDDVSEIDRIDFCQINVQGGEMALLQAAIAKLADAVVVQIECPFVKLYDEQATLGEIDVELRQQGFLPHCFIDVRPWPLTEYGLRGGANPRRNPIQIMVADAVYIRDLTRPERVSDEQLKHLALIARECYGATDLARYCRTLLKERDALPHPGDAEEESSARVAAEAGRSLPDTLGAPAAPTEPEPPELPVAPAEGPDPGEEHWPDVQNTHLTAWQDNPADIDPLYQLACHYRAERRFQLGHLFAEAAFDTAEPNAAATDRAAPLPWRVLDERAICASRIGRKEEAFALCRQLLARADLPNRQRGRITGNRNFSVPAMIQNASAYPAGLIERLRTGARTGPVTVSLVAGPDRSVIEQTLNSLLNSCTDLSAVGRFVVLNAGLSAADRKALGRRYGFVEFIRCTPGDAAHRRQLRPTIDTRFWLHIGVGWTFFAPEDLIGRLIAVLEAEPAVVQVAVNLDDAREATEASPPESAVRRAPGAGRYVLGSALARGPAMFDTARLADAGGFAPADRESGIRLAGSAREADVRTATLDEVLCTLG